MRLVFSHRAVNKKSFEDLFLIAVHFVSVFCKGQQEWCKGGKKQPRTNHSILLTKNKNPVRNYLLKSHADC